jgi:8-oxo-dGTP diphosphatase
MTGKYLTLLMLLLTGCTKAPDCQFEGEPLTAKSAGCLVYQNNTLLLVSSHDDEWGPPGGSVDAGESAQCAATRETWEETSLEVSAGELVRIFDNGFHLFWCSSVLLSEPEIRRPLEIKATAFYPVSSFGTLNWRFPDQGDALTALIADRLETEANAK